MSEETTWVKCKHCLFATKEAIIVQFREGYVCRWNYCPSCGEEWEQEEIGTTSEESNVIS